MITRHRLRIPVDGGWEIAAWLTVPDELRSQFLQILVHGGTYTHHYWDFPYQPERYSYVAWAADEGYATLNIDRLGAGASSRPPGLAVDIPVQARILDHLVGLSRRGLDGPDGPVRFDGAVMLGHSVGSIVTGLAATSAAARAVVLTGTTVLASRVESGDARTGPGNFLPARDDPGLADRHALLDDGYFTLRPEARVPMWFYAANSDPEVVTVDERLKDTMTVGEIASLGPAVDAARQIRLPVLGLLGQYDVMMFDPRTDTDGYDAMKRAADGAPENFTFEVVPDAGHNLNLHRNAHAGYRLVAGFLSNIRT